MRKFVVMGLLPKKEFAEKCGIQTKVLSVYIKRGKVVVTDSGMIDDTNLVNQQFIKNQELIPRKKTRVSENAPVVLDEKPQKAQKRENKNDNDKKLDERFDLDTEKKRMEIEKLQRESRVAEAQHQKLMGKMLPTDPVKTLFIQTIKAYTVSFRQAAEKIIMEFATINKMNRNDLAQMRGELITAINRAAEEGNAESKKAVIGIIREYSQAKK